MTSERERERESWECRRRCSAELAGTGCCEVPRLRVLSTVFILCSEVAQGRSSEQDKVV